MSVRVLIVDDHAVFRAGLQAADRRGGRPRGGGRGRQRPRRRFPVAGAQAGRDPHGRRHARPERARRPADAAARAARDEGAHPLDAGRPAVCPAGVQLRCERLHPEGGRRHRGGGGDQGSRRAETATSTRPSAPALSQPRTPRRAAPRRIRSPTGSARCCGCSPSVTRIRRSLRSSSSRCEPPRRTARTSCRSSGSRAGPSSCATRSSRACWSSDPKRRRAARRRLVGKAVRVRCYAVGTISTFVFFALLELRPRSGLRSAPPIARIPKPSPASRSAMPTTSPNSESCSAM